MVSVGMTGSRNGLTAEQRQAAADWLLTIQPEWLHHGDCIGADAELDGIARELDIQTCVHPPERSDRRAYCEGDVILQPLPYLMRNQGIVAESDILLAFPDGPEKLRSGTSSTVKYAARRVFRSSLSCLMVTSSSTTRCAGWTAGLSTSSPVAFVAGRVRPA